MKNPIALVALLTAAAATTSGCASLQRSMGQGKIVPDEFRVVTSAPLTLPPEYSLRPPRPGEPRPQELESNAERSALFGQDTGANATPGERAFVSSAGAAAVDAGIRDTVDYEGQGIVRRNEQFANRVNEFGTARDQTDEARRVEEEEAIRRATGGGDVSIRRGGAKLPGT